MSMAKFGSNIAEFVKRFRQEGSLTQAELAEAIGVSRSYVSNVEHKLHPRPMSFCVKLRPHLDEKRLKYLDDFLNEAMESSVEFRLDAIDRRSPKKRVKKP